GTWTPAAKWPPTPATANRSAACRSPATASNSPAAVGTAPFACGTWPAARRRWRSRATAKRSTPSPSATAQDRCPSATTVLIPAAGGGFASNRLRQNRGQESAVHVGRAHVAPAPTHCQALVVDPQEMQHRGVQVVDLDFLRHDLVAPFVGFA